MSVVGPRLQIQGERSSGQDVRSQNVTAVAAIANIVKTSLGPVGLDKVWRRKQWAFCSIQCKFPIAQSSAHWPT